MNSFFANIQQVLDNNYDIGEYMLLNVVLILQKTPFPPRHASSFVMTQSYNLTQEKFLFQGCGFSLWYMEPAMRKNWLTTVLVIAYKYSYSPETVIGEKVVGLIRIIIHTLAAHAHVCDRYSRPTFAARSRDMSQVSLGGAGPGGAHHQEQTEGMHILCSKYSLHWVLRPASVTGIEVAKPKWRSLNQVDFRLVVAKSNFC